MSAAAFDPGWLRHRIVIEAATPAGDGAGGETLAWATVATLWSRIDPVAASERSAGEHLATVATHRVTIRWRDDVTGGMRVAYRGRYFRIAATRDPDETQRYLELTAIEERP
ncbi:MAG TPA: phage head closure protein [Bauldia sp.]|nr:phage head closure protein [Bauldia sp.]